MSDDESEYVDASGSSSTSSFAIPAVASPAIVSGVARIDKYKLTFKRLDQQVAQALDNDVVSAIASGEAVDRELRIYQSLRVLPRVVETVVEDPETGLPSYTINNPLAWWKEHAATLPILSSLAHRTLCVPASSAPSERLFSLAGLTIAKDRAGLTPENAADLVFLKSVWTTLENVVAAKKRNSAAAGLV